ncbi:MAG: SDR family NAD(P)-dependent oxidoreductase [Gammaproteobacteria bacterium]
MTPPEIACFKDRTVLVTGASRGIGRAIAQRFAHLGARLAIHFNTRAQDAAEVVASLPGAGHACFAADLGNEISRRSLIDAVTATMGVPDVLVNNAGLYQLTPLAHTDEPVWIDTFKTLIEINLIAPAHLAYLTARAMIDQDRPGRIINIGSRGAYRGEPDAPGYGSAKAGLHALTQSLALALGPHRISVTAVAPGWVETDMASPHLEGPRGSEIRSQSPLGRVAQPEEVAAAVVYLAGIHAEYATGAVLDLNGASYLR